MRLVLSKSRQETRGCDGLNLTKLDKILRQVGGFESSLFSDLCGLSELERRVKELQLAFNEVVKMVSRETHDNLVSQLNERQRQA